MDKRRLKVQQNDEFFLELIKDRYLTIFNDGKVFNNKTRKYISSVAGKYYQICYNGHNIVVHRLVYILYIDDIPFGYEINHIDGNKLNNHYTNLEAVTQSENGKHAFRIGLKKKKLGENNPQSKLKDLEVIEIRKKYTTGNYSYSKLAKEYKINKVTIQYIIKGKTYKHLPLFENNFIRENTNKSKNFELNKRIILLHNKGLSSYKIAEQITEISRATIQRIINNYNDSGLLA